jgi:hypothetical protein
MDNYAIRSARRKSETKTKTFKNHNVKPYQPATVYSDPYIDSPTKIEIDENKSKFSPNKQKKINKMQKIKGDLMFGDLMIHLSEISSKSSPKSSKNRKNGGKHTIHLSKIPSKNSSKSSKNRKNRKNGGKIYL